MREMEMIRRGFSTKVEAIEWAEEKFKGRRDCYLAEGFDGDYNYIVAYWEGGM